RAQEDEGGGALTRGARGRAAQVRSRLIDRARRRDRSPRRAFWRAAPTGGPHPSVLRPRPKTGSIRRGLHGHPAAERQGASIDQDLLSAWRAPAADRWHPPWRADPRRAPPRDG